MTHGHSKRGQRSPEFRTWLHIRRRCNDPNDIGYKDYGGRGIQVCDRWNQSFEDFLADVGPKPSGMTLDRFPNNDGNYEPGNVRWATPKEQANNRRPASAHTAPRSVGRNNTSGIVGVSLMDAERGYWGAFFRKKFLGNFRSKEAAAAARKAAEQEAFS